MRARSIALLLAVGACLAAVATTSIASADGDDARDASSALVDCSKFPTAPDGSRRQSFDSVDVTGAIAGMPPRVIADVQPGERAQVCVGFHNRTGREIDLDLRTADVAADPDGSPASQQDAEDFGASTWLHLPARRIERLDHGDIAWLNVAVDVPGDALAGSSYASVIATVRERELAPGGGAQVNAVPAVAVQLFFDIPGDAGRSGKIEDARMPRVIWWDGLDLGRFPVLDRLRGAGIATARFRWRNTGEYTDELAGSMRVRSDLSKHQVVSIPIGEQVVLRGSGRTFEATWKRDIPMLGRFTPTIELTGRNGTTVDLELDPVWVIPSWWYLLALVLAVAIPLWMRRRSKRRYRDLVERLEAAEARADGDEAWESDADAWNDHD